MLRLIEILFVGWVLFVIYRGLIAPFIRGYRSVSSLLRRQEPRFHSEPPPPQAAPPQAAQPTVAPGGQIDRTKIQEADYRDV